MSGGSYEYLYIKTASDMFANDDARANLEKMRDRLDGLGYAQDATRETDEVIAIMRQAEIRLQIRLDRLSRVWHAVEWWDSGDSGEGGIQRSLLEYRCDLRMQYDREATIQARQTSGDYGVGSLYRVYRLVGRDMTEQIAGPISEAEALTMLEEAAGAHVGRP